MGNPEQRINITLATCEAEMLIEKLEIAIEEARDHGENEKFRDFVRNIEYKIVPTLEEKGEALRRMDNDQTNNDVG